MDFKKLLLTTDLSFNADAATPYAALLARKYGAKVILLHVLDDSAYYGGGGDFVFHPDEWLAEARQDLEQRLAERAARILEAEGIAVEPVLLAGNPARKIIAYAEAERPDCIIMATHGRTGIPRFIFGSVAERILRLSPCPVFTIRPPWKEQHAAGAVIAREHEHSVL